MWRPLTVALCIALAAPVAAALRWQDAESWMAHELIPGVVSQLRDHPRFRGQAIRIVVFENGAPAASTNRFALSLRNRLSSALLQVPGIRLAAPASDSNQLDCSRDDVDYYVGLEITRDGHEDIQLTLRTLDARSNTWVTGLDQRWTGALTHRQQRALAEPALDPQRRGQRGAPFAPAELDVLARTLARELACASVRQLGGNYVVFIEPESDTALPGVGTLVGNNLAGLVAMQFTDDATRANAVLGSSTHRIDTDLNQLWVTLTPVSPTASLPALTANAYIRQYATRNADIAPDPAAPVDSTMPAAARARQRSVTPAPTHVVSRTVALAATGGHAFNDVGLVTRRGSAACGRRHPCTALRLTSRETTALFLFRHQPEHGLVRFGTDRCDRDVPPRVLQSSQTVTVAVPAVRVQGAQAVPARELEVTPHTEMLYALAVTDSRAALSFSRHLRTLPQRCVDANRHGMRGDALEAWLATLAELVETWADDVDLRAIALAETA